MKAAREKENRVGRLKKAQTHSERVPDREDPQVEAKKEIKTKKWDKDMKTMIREIREENKVLRKKLAAVGEEKGELRRELAAR
jgi:hypothetical protein